MNARKQLYSYQHLQETEPTNFKIDEVTAGALLSMGTLPTTEKIILVKCEIKSKKYENLCRVKNLNLGG